MADVADVFISYYVASASGVVRKISEELERRGISCWYAERDFAIGEDFARTVPQQIEACRVFLLILDEGANRSRHVENELGLAYRERTRGEEIDIVPFQVEKCALSRSTQYYLSNVRKIDGAAPPMGARIRELADRIAKIVSRSEPPVTPDVEVSKKRLFRIVLMAPFGRKRREERKEAERQKRELREAREELRRAKEETERLREELRRRKNV